MHASLSSRAGAHAAADTIPYPPDSNSAAATGPDYQVLAGRHPQLFGNRDITPLELHRLNEDFRHVPDVPQESFYLTVVNDHDPTTIALGTSGMSACLAICARGKTAQGTTVLWLSHTSGPTPNNPRPENFFNQAMMDLEAAGCVRDSIRMYLVGGQERPPGMGPDPVYERMLQATSGFPLVGARLPLVAAEEDEEARPANTAVIFTATDLYFHTGMEDLALGEAPGQPSTDSDAEDADEGSISSGYRCDASDGEATESAESDQDLPAAKRPRLHLAKCDGSVDKGILQYRPEKDRAPQQASHRT